MKVGQLPLKASGFWLAESGMNNKGTTPLRPTSQEPAIEPIHGDQYESIFFVEFYMEKKFVVAAGSFQCHKTFLEDLTGNLALWLSSGWNSRFDYVFW